MGLFVRQIAVGGYDNNFSYLVYETESKQAMVVDPSGSLDRILATADALELDIVGVLITHTHFDHMDQLAELLRKCAIPVFVHKEGEHAIVSPGPIRGITEGDTIELGTHTFEVFHTPGHTDEAVCYFISAANAENKVPKVITGDTLFVERCGCTNAAGVRALYDSLLRLKALPPETEVYPGHDYGSKPHSTIAWEHEHNKYFLVKDFEAFRTIRLN